MGGLDKLWEDELAAGGAWFGGAVVSVLGIGRDWDVRRGQRSEKSEATWRKCPRASHCDRAADYLERWPEIWIQ